MEIYLSILLRLITVGFVKQGLARLLVDNQDRNQNSAAQQAPAPCLNAIANCMAIQKQSLENHSASALLLWVGRFPDRANRLGLESLPMDFQTPFLPAEIHFEIPALMSGLHLRQGPELHSYPWQNHLRFCDQRP